MSAWALCQYVATDLDPSLGPALRQVGAAEPDQAFVWDLIEPSAFEHCQAGLGVVHCVVDPAGCIALGGHHVELRQPAVFDDPRGFDNLLGPGGRLRCSSQMPSIRRQPRPWRIQVALVGAQRIVRMLANSVVNHCTPRRRGLSYSARIVISARR